MPVEVREEVNDRLRGVRALLVCAGSELWHDFAATAFDEPRVEQELGGVEPLRRVSYPSVLGSNNSQQGR
jgi:hypothetical protein